MAVHCARKSFLVKSSKRMTLAVGVAVKLTPLTLVLLVVAVWLARLKVAVWLLGVMVYAPLEIRVKVLFPEASAVVVAPAAPLSVTVGPAAIEAGLMVPEMVSVGGR
jgi:hypothetical protein